MLRLFSFASLCECCAFVLPSSASLLSPSAFAWSLSGGRCVFTIVCLCTHQFMVYTTETVFGNLIVMFAGLLSEQRESDKRVFFFLQALFSLQSPPKSLRDESCSPVGRLLQ